MPVPPWYVRLAVSLFLEVGVKLVVTIGVVSRLTATLLSLVSAADRSLSERLQPTINPEAAKTVIIGNIFIKRDCSTYLKSPCRDETSLWGKTPEVVK